METIKKTAVNTLATTALTLVALGCIAFAMGGNCLFLRTIFECLAANLLIHVGLPFVRLIESRYMLLDLLFEVGYVLLVLIPFGFVFGWYATTPLWVVICMGVVIYLLGNAINIMKINKDVGIINEELNNLRGIER